MPKNEANLFFLSLSAECLYIQQKNKADIFGFMSSAFDAFGEITIMMAFNHQNGAFCYLFWWQKCHIFSFYE